jgi:hypothetical protein
MHQIAFFRLSISLCTDVKPLQQANAANAKFAGERRQGAENA